MPRARKPENAGLRTRWRHTHGGYYYQVPPGQEDAWDGKKTFRLGGNLAEAYKVWAAKLQSVDLVRTIGALLDRYALEVIPTKAVTTQSHKDCDQGRAPGLRRDVHRRPEATPRLSVH